MHCEFKFRTRKLLEKNEGENLQDLGPAKIFLDLTPKVQFHINKNWQTGCYQNLKFCSAKGPVQMMKTQSMTGRKYMQTHVQHRSTT